MKRTALAILVFLLPPSAQAYAEWPQDRPIRLLVGFGAGGGTDIVARIIADHLSKELQQSVVVENKVGAGGVIAGNDVAKAPKDGYTAGLISTGHAVSAVMVKNLPYDAIRDFAPTALVANSGFVFVARKDFPADDIRGLVGLAKASPGKLNFASVGLGSTQHFAGELLAQETGITVTHIPYRGTPAVVAALLSGEADYSVELVHTVLGQVRAGKLKLLAAGSPKRWATIQDVPTAAESGVPDYKVVGWYGWVYPAGTPQAIIDTTARALRRTLERPTVKEQLDSAGAIVSFGGPAQLAQTIKHDVATWKVVRDRAHINPN